MTNDSRTKLIQEAVAAKENAYAPYSNFRVGAALLLENGRIYRGCNVENSSYGLTVCAERVAVFKAVSEGEQDFTAIAIATDTERFCPPCGACRQVLVEYAPDLEIVLVDVRGESEKMSLSKLLPAAFNKDFFAK